jgi:hypothetical protein
MFRKFVLLILLFTFVGTAAFAEDLNPPDWRGAPDSYQALFTHSENMPCPDLERISNLGIYPDCEIFTEGDGGPPTWTFYDTWIEWVQYEADCPETEPAEDVQMSVLGGNLTWHEEYAGRDGVYEVGESEGFEYGQYYNFGVGEWPSYEIGMNLYQAQVVYSGEEQLWGSIWTEFSDESYVFEYWWTVEEVDLGDGWTYALLAFELEGPLPSGDWQSFYLEGGGYIDWVLWERVWYYGEEPPEGTDASCTAGPKVIQVSEPSPTPGETGIPHDVNTVLSFRASKDAICIAIEEDPDLLNDPCVDVNEYLQGDFTYDVFWGKYNDSLGGDGEPNRLLMTQLTDDYAPTECNDVMTFDPISGGFDHEPGTTYVWIVDINDANDAGDKAGPGPEDPIVYPGPAFTYQTWGFAQNEIPEDGTDGLNPGIDAVTMIWENDGYATDYVATLYADDGETVLAGPAALGPNTWTPSYSYGLGQTLIWVIDECNDFVDLGSGAETICVPGVQWTFTMSLCETVDDFESYSGLSGTGNAWKDWYDDTTSTNAVINWLVDATPPSSDLLKGQVYQYSDPDSVKSMNINVDRDFMDATYKDYTWFEPADANLARDGGKTIWVAYRSADAGASPPDPANNENIFMGFESSDSNTANIDYPGDVCDTEWSIFFVALSEAVDQGVDVTDVVELRIGATGDTGNTGTYDVYVDLVTRCAPICPYDFGYPDLVQGAFAPSYTKLASDLVGPERGYDVRSGLAGDTTAPDCVVDETDMQYIAGFWLDEDYTVTPVEPNSDFLLVEYTFDAGNSNDTSGNDLHGVDTNSPLYADGKVTLDGNDFIEIPFAAKDINNPFGRPESYTITLDVNTVDRGLIFSSAREPNCVEGGLEEPWDPEDPCSAPYYETWPLAIYSVVEGELSELAQAHYWYGSTGNEADLGVEHRVVYVYNVEEETGILYVDGESDWINEELYLDIPEPNEDTVLIGSTLNCHGPDEWQEEPMGRFIGTLDNVRVYTYAFSDEEVLYYNGTTDPYPVPVDPIANMYATGDPDADDGDIINFFDQATFAPQWMEENFFE